MKNLAIFSLYCTKYHDGDYCHHVATYYESLAQIDIVCALQAFIVIIRDLSFYRISLYRKHQRIGECTDD